MPQGDRTGPKGQGSRTGRSSGLCSGYDTPGFTKGYEGQGRGFGIGRGMRQGRGFGRSSMTNNAFSGLTKGFPWISSLSKEEEIKILKSQADSLKSSQQAIEKRIEELEKEMK